MTSVSVTHSASVYQDKEDKLREAKATYNAWAEKKESSKEDTIRKKRAELKEAREKEEESQRKKRDAKKVGWEGK